MDGLKVRFVGPVKRPGPAREVVLDRSGLYTVADVLARLGYSSEDAARLTVLLDGVRVEREARVQDASTMDILLLIGGG